MKNFIQQANSFGKARTPFFFLIDFEQQKPIILSLAELNASGQISAMFCTSQSVQLIKPFEINIEPLNFGSYKQGFERVKREIQLGNSYLLNLTYPTKISTNYSLEEIYQASHAKYKCYLKEKFVCFSPECFVRIQNNQIFSYPMKGTINAELENAQTILINSEKELTEHNTIVDLIRNDLALVSEKVEVRKYRYIEEIKTHKGAIYQTSSEICGQLHSNWQNDIGTILAKLLPAGSISGAPKVKTVEIIQQVEPITRGYYTGVFGYFDGETLESAVAIRYIEQRDQALFFRSGGGITHLSHLAEEYNEILEKIYVPII